MSTLGASQQHDLPLCYVSALRRFHLIIEKKEKGKKGLA